MLRRMLQFYALSVISEYVQDVENVEDVDVCMNLFSIALTDSRG